MAKPGVMIYFDMRESIQELTDDEKGRLLVAILEYGELGVIPEFTGILKAVWGFIRPKLDRDNRAYEDTVAKRKYAAYCKKQRKSEFPELPFDEWRSTMDDSCQHVNTHDNTCYPTTTVTPTINTTSSVSTSSTATPTATGTVNATRRRPLTFDDEQQEDCETLRQQKIQMLQDYV